MGEVLSARCHPSSALCDIANLGYDDSHFQLWVIQEESRTVSKDSEMERGMGYCGCHGDEWLDWLPGGV